MFDSLPTGAVPSSMHEAYRAEEMLVRELLARSGGRVIGYKIAATNAAAQQLLQVDAPFFGQLLSDSSYPSPATLPSGEFTVRCVEAEFGVEIGGDVRPGDRPYTRESIAEFIAAVIPSIEVVDHRFADWAAVGAPSLVADNAIHGGMDRGPAGLPLAGGGPGRTPGHAVRERPSREHGLRRRRARPSAERRRLARE